MTTYTFRDARLRTPALRLMNAAGVGLGAVGLRRPTLEPEAIINSARRQAGLDSAVDDETKQALNRFVHSAESEANLNTLGRIAVQSMLVNSLASRFRVQDWCERHPDIRQETISQPWIVVGLPRTGTSILSILLGLDPFSRPLLQWEAKRPIPPADLATAQEDPRITLFAQEIARISKMNPALATMHPFGSTLAEECTAIFTYALRTVGMETVAFVPSYGRWLDDADMTPAYAIHKLTLQALQHAQPTERWTLKSPNHLWSLPELLTAYPDARIIWIHRDPARVVTSLASLNCALQLQFTRRLDAKRVGQYWAEKIGTAIGKASVFDETAAPDWCCHVQYRDLLAEPKTALEGIYNHFSDSMNTLHKRRVDAWLNQRPQHAEGVHSYDPGDFGWTQKMLTERYSGYRQRYAVAEDS
jgi:hypothetical protein